MTDTINPQHYKGAGGLEVIDVIEAFGLQHDYYLATALKYILRAGKKASSPAAEDIAKAIWFLERANVVVKTPRIESLPLGTPVEKVLAEPEGPAASVAHRDSPQTELLPDGIESGRE